jgi:SAM-dependent methyltransferase
MHPSIFTPSEATEHHHSIRFSQVMEDLFSLGEPVYDFGCGDGFYIHELEKKGFQCFGVEGTTGMKDLGLTKSIIEADLTRQFPPLVPAQVMSIEVAEHIDKEHEAQFLKTITQASKHTLLLTWAVPGQGGRRHVNEQPEEYVVQALANHGFKFIEDWTRMARLYVASEVWYFGGSIYLFERV